jgi:Zn-dependent protease with chaperone function
MFGNFIYFILALLIVSTYQPSEEPGLAAAESLLLFAALSAAFAAFVRLTFRRIERLAGALPFGRLDAMFHSAQLRCSVAAVAVFAVEVYGLGLPALADDLPLLSAWPTLKALVFVALFVAHLALVWALAFDAYRRLYGPAFGRREYLVSNLSFAAPVLIPWALMSTVLDLVHALPFPGAARWLATTEGQIAFNLTFLLAVAITGPALIKRFWRCAPLAPGPARERIEALCRRAGVACADILAWPLFGGRMITAAVMGLVARFRYILVTPAMLELLDPEEVDAVVAHEIGHVKRRHLLFYLMFLAGYLLLATVAFDVALYFVIFIDPVWELVQRSGASQATVASVVFSVFILALFLVYFRFVFGFFMRNFERQADGYVFTLFDSARPLVATFHKIALTSGQSADRPNWHHYSIRERVDHLARCELDRGRLRRHDRKVRRGIALYLAAMALVAAAGYQLNLGTVGSRLNEHLMRTVVERQLEKAPDNPALHALMGDLGFRRKDYALVQRSYERALELKPDSPAVLNNLAWLYATCEDERFRDPPRALELAQAAARLQPAAHVLDTLAEAYFANGKYAEAVAVGGRALAAAAGDRRHYEAQLEKFTEALRRASGA